MENLVGKKIIDVIPVETLEVSTYTRFVISQLEFCQLPPIQMVGKRKWMPLGFPGLRCQYCNKDKRLRCGSYFPSSLKTMSDSSKTLFAIDSHLQKCTACPEEIKQKLIDTKTTHLHERRRNKRHGGQKAAFWKIWNVMHPDEEAVNEIAHNIFIQNRILRFAPTSAGTDTNVELDSSEERKMETTTLNTALASSQQEPIAKTTAPSKQQTDVNMELSKRKMVIKRWRQESAITALASDQQAPIAETTAQSRKLTKPQKKQRILEVKRWRQQSAKLGPPQVNKDQ